MTCYVDDMRAPYGRLIMCHLLAETDEELHAMADKIGVARKWWQDKKSGSHYDICLSKRALAVQHGAVEVTMKQMAMLNVRRRVTGKMGPLEEVEAWFSLYLSKKEKDKKDECARQDSGF